MFLASIISSQDSLIKEIPSIAADENYAEIQKILSSSIELLAKAKPSVEGESGSGLLITTATSLSNWDAGKPERSGTEQNETEPEVIDAQYGLGRQIRGGKIGVNMSAH